MSGKANYEDADSPAEARIIWREEHLCLRCALSPICHLGKVADSVAAVILPVVSRCSSYSEVPE